MAIAFHAEGSHAQVTGLATLSITTTDGLNISVGDNVTVFGSWSQASTTTPTVATTGGTGSDTFTLVYGPFTDAGSGVKYAAWLLASAGSGRTGVNLTWASSSPAISDASCISFTGLTTPVLDGNATGAADAGGGSTAITSADTATLASAAEFAIGYCETTGGVVSADAPWTNDGNIGTTASGVEHQILSATTAIHTNFHTTGKYLTFVLTFMEASIYLRPDADSIDGSWTNELGGTVLFSSIDETVASDTDYIRSSVNPSSDLAKISLSNPSGGFSAPVVLRYRYRKTSTQTANLAVRLLQGATQIAAFTHTAISDSFVTTEQTLTQPQLALITDFTDLYIELTAS